MKLEPRTHLDSTSPTPGAWELPGPDGARSLEQLDIDIAETSAHIAAATGSSPTSRSLTGARDGR